LAGKHKTKRTRPLPEFDVIERYTRVYGDPGFERGYPFEHRVSHGTLGHREHIEEFRERRQSHTLDAHPLIGARDYPYRRGIEPGPIHVEPDAMTGEHPSCGREVPYDDPLHADTEPPDKPDGLSRAGTRENPELEGGGRPKDDVWRLGPPKPKSPASAEPHQAEEWWEEEVEGDDDWKGSQDGE